MSIPECPCHTAPSKSGREADEAEDGEAKAGAGAEGGGDIAGAGHPEQRDCQVSKGGHNLGPPSSGTVGRFSSKVTSRT